MRARADELRSAVYVSDQLRGVGVDMAIEPLDLGVVNARLSEGRFEAALSRFFQAPRALKNIFGPNSRGGYRSAKLVELADRWSLTADPLAVDRIRREIADIFLAEMPMTFLFPVQTITFAHRRLRGLSSPWSVDPFSVMGELWLDDHAKD